MKEIKLQMKLNKDFRLLLFFVELKSADKIIKKAINKTGISKCKKNSTYLQNPLFLNDFH